MADIDEIVLEIKSMEAQTEVEVDTQPTRKRRRRQVRVVRWSPVKRRDSSIAESVQQESWHTTPQLKGIGSGCSIEKEVEAIYQLLSLRL